MPSLEYWKEEIAKEQGICWQDNSNIYRRMWTKDTVTNPNYWSTVKPKYGFAKDIIVKRARLSLELSGIVLAEEEYHGAANWSDIVEEEGEETQ
ncbi:hypothetical protein QOT17_001779 [Balamuthia mandrillaris]